MNRATFRDWLRDQESREDPLGDLARDVAADRKCPDNPAPGDLITHLHAVHACQKAVDAAMRAAIEWRES